jgi:hypothetical protein
LASLYGLGGWFYLLVLSRPTLRALSLKLKGATGTFPYFFAHLLRITKYPKTQTKQLRLQLDAAGSCY